MVNRSVLLSTVVFSILAVWSHWNLFSNGVSALGFNFTLFWLGFALIIYFTDSSYCIRQDWVWLCPIFLIGLSYGLYENPWLKLISLILLPVVSSIFCAYSHLCNRGALVWNRRLLSVIGSRVISPFGATGKACVALGKTGRMLSSGTGRGLFVRVLTGVLILIPLSFLVVFLLASADEQFAGYVAQGLDALLDAVSWSVVVKLCAAAFLSIALLSIAIGWSGVLAYTESVESRVIDGLVAGIVLGGLLVIYISFLLLQIDHLVIQALPENYREAEHLVKSGFWQLLFLAVLNTLLFFIVYRKTGNAAQWVLRLFIVISSLLMVSAAWKVWLYSYTFGLSYEKYFACYTAVFALGVLIYLVTASFSGYRKNVVKTIAFAALWGYGAATVTPVEKVIFYANLHFAEQDDTRITLDQLNQLSIDILPDVDKAMTTRLASESESIWHWQRWRENQIVWYCNRKWYEMNLSAMRACA